MAWIQVAVAIFLSLWAPAHAERFEIRSAETIVMPGIADSNSPALWRDGEFRIFSSNGTPALSIASDPFFTVPSRTVPVRMDSGRLPVWFESVWVDADGTIYGWYHHEQFGLCPDLTVPAIGAAVSFDGGENFYDLGLILTAPDPPDCSARNGYFAGGHGDFTVILDRENRYFYFLYGNYGGPADRQGVSIARMAFEDRFFPAGRVMKYADGEWSQPGLGGRQSPVFHVRVPWQDEATDAFWGPSVHWNTHLNAYVMLLNRACCQPGWPQEGVYISFNADIANPSGWSAPERVFEEGFDPGWYPQVLGIGPGETDSVAGRVARLFVHGRSEWEIHFE